MKQYEVDILSKHSHGRYGKEFFTNWCLSHTSKAGAEDFALDILSGKTWAELIEEIEMLKGRPLGDMETIRYLARTRGFKESDVIGLENAQRYFSFKAYALK